MTNPVDPIGAEQSPVLLNTNVLQDLSEWAADPAEGNHGAVSLMFDSATSTNQWCMQAPTNFVSVDWGSIPMNSDDKNWVSEAETLASLKTLVNDAL